MISGIADTGTPFLTACFGGGINVPHGTGIAPCNNTVARGKTIDGHGINRSLAVEQRLATNLDT